MIPRIARTAAAALALAFAAAPAAAAPKTLANGWFYDEPGNSCLAVRQVGAARIVLRLTRWDDRSDNIHFYRPNLPLLWSEEGYPSGRTEAEEQADQDAGFHLEVRIDGRVVPDRWGGNAMLFNDPKEPSETPGAAYKYGIDQAAFLRALRTGRTLELFHRGKRLISAPISRSADMARRMTACVAREPEM